MIINTERKVQKRSDGQYMINIPLEIAKIMDIKKNETLFFKMYKSDVFIVKKLK